MKGSWEVGSALWELEERLAAGWQEVDGSSSFSLGLYSRLCAEKLYGRVDDECMVILNNGGDDTDYDDADDDGCKLKS